MTRASAVKIFWDLYDTTADGNGGQLQAEYRYVGDFTPAGSGSTLGLFYTQSIDANGNATETYVDTQGRTVRTAYADGSYTQTLYGFGNQAVTGYAISGQAITGYEEVQIDQAGNATEDFYDAAGNLTDVYLPAVADGLNGNAMTVPHWTYVYDASGNEVLQVSPKEQSAYQSWLSAGHSAASFTGGTSYGYDSQGNKVSTTLPDGEMQTWTYDVFGNQTLHKYYSAGNHTTATKTFWDIYDTTADGNGGQLEAEYRYVGDFTPGGSGLAYAAGTSWEHRTLYTYDDQGRQINVEDDVNANGTASQLTYTAYTYDPISGQQASITTPDGTIDYTYNEVTGDLIETETGHNNEFYVYDNQNRLTQIDTLELNGTAYGSVSTNPTTYTPTFSGTPLVTAYAYDNDGNTTSVTAANGMATTYTYNDLNELTGESVAVGWTSLFSQTYMYFATGNRATDIEGHYTGGTLASTIEYDWTYDPDGRLTSEQLKIDSGSSSLVPYTDVFKYDLNNNRVEEDTTGGNAGTGTNTYTYNGDDEPATATRTGSNPYAITYTFDSDGNLISQVQTGTGAQTITYGYNLQDMMTLCVVGSSTTTYGYDTQGILAGETAGSTTRYYLNDPNDLTGYTKAIEQSTSLGGSPSRSYVLGQAVVAQSDNTNGVLYLLTDGHGSTRAVVNSSGTVVQSYDYDAFGGMLETGISPKTTWLSGGDGSLDSFSGLTYHDARWTEGFFFTQTDGGRYVTNGNPITANNYLYGNADPITQKDPSGHAALFSDVLISQGEDLAAEAGELVTDSSAETYAGDLFSDITIEEDATTSLAEEIGSDAPSADIESTITETQNVDATFSDTVTKPPALARDAATGLNIQNVGSISNWGTGPEGAINAMQNLTQEEAQQILNKVGSDYLLKVKDFYQSFADYLKLTNPTSLMDTPTPILRAQLMEKIIELAAGGGD